MSDEVKEPITIIVSLDPNTGEINVNGPLHNELLIYGMLEKARQITHDFTRRATAPLIAAPGRMPFPKAVQ